MRFICCILFLAIFTNCAGTEKDILIKFEENRKYSKNVSKVLFFDLFNNRINRKYTKPIFKTALQKDSAYSIQIFFAGYDNVKFTDKGIYDLWNTKDRTYNNYSFLSEEIKNKLESYKEYNYWFENEPDLTSTSPLHFYISNDIINDYSNYKHVNMYGMAWHVYSGKTDGTEIAKYTELTHEFEIWISEDLKTWMEFYKNKQGELRIAAEGLFTDPNDNSVIKKPESANKLHENFLRTYHNTYIFRNNILKGTVLGEGL